MRLSLLTFACSLYLIADALHLYGSEGSSFNVQSEAYIKALTAEIDCNKYVSYYSYGPRDIVPTKDLCRPCHIRHNFNLELGLPNFKSTGFDPKKKRYFKDLRALVYMECPKEALAESFAPISQEGPSNTTESAQETSTMSDTGSNTATTAATATTATTAATRSTVTITSSPSTERNRAKKFEPGYIFSYWAPVLMLF
ncbi:uncharacterized protein FTJAE_10033 [Fusarium tjaetaba]|uniref:Uncharacterized protein n=1 Tax=Fusarium tjaetaba TaxID=1567544 RepID=A0A8H5QY59_9HYPO|nr:uncharacterized protein FTJAE_10033 [Fusarium tjaetaba]KAF5625315.1 hypothetical protein FTJAE_10033 [Fusarium tjaetaba]